MECTNVQMSPTINVSYNSEDVDERCRLKLTKH